MHRKYITIENHNFNFLIFFSSNRKHNFRITNIDFKLAIVSFNLYKFVFANKYVEDIDRYESGREYSQSNARFVRRSFLICIFVGFKNRLENTKFDSYFDDKIKSDKDSF